MSVIYVDADACPVKAEVVRVAERHTVLVKLVSNSGLRPGDSKLVENVVVPAGADAADKWISDRAGPGDVCITSDIPLAARCVEKGALVLKPNGDLLDAANVGNALAMRDLMADIRSANPLSQGGGGKPFSRQDRSRFLEVLDREVRTLLAQSR